jgi:hypothetical protein
LGRGLRQITGSVASGGGRIIIKSCNRQIVLRPSIKDGLTKIEEAIEIQYPTGTSITIEVDPAYPADPYALQWANTAIRLARRSEPPYLGRPSVHWFDTDAFAGLLRAVPSELTLKEFLTKFDGCSSKTVQQAVARGFGSKCLCGQLTRDSTAELLRLLQGATKPIKANRLRATGQGAWPDYHNGYNAALSSFVIGAREPFAKVPFKVECWARVQLSSQEDLFSIFDISTSPWANSLFASAKPSSSDSDVRIGEITINRTPTFIYSSINRKRGRDIVLNLNASTINLSLPRGREIEFTLNITSPFVPILSGSKTPSFSPFCACIKKVVEQVINSACRSVRKRLGAPTTTPGRALVPHQTGPLHRILIDATHKENCNADELTVLSTDKDPYRLDNASGHRVGRWCAQMIERSLAPDARIHLRGLHYLLSSAGDVTRPDGERYINTDEMWRWLTETAIKAARWLGYVVFERIVDERNAPPQLYLPPYYTVETERARGQRIIIPGLDEAVPGFTSPLWPVIQPHRVILIGEKTSLRPVLLPIAQEVGGELLLPTGEPSDTMIYELAARCVNDKRPSVILYFSDFDPSGRQMPVSVSRKLQALYDLRFGKLNIQLHPVALTLDQVRELNLPSTPLKETEMRASRWREVMRHQQTEIDALAALNPDALTTIARDAIRPYYDPTLAERTHAAEHDWRDECEELLERLPAYADARTAIEVALEPLQQRAQKLEQLQDQAAALLADIQPPPSSYRAPKTTRPVWSRCSIPGPTLPRRAVDYDDTRT